MTTKESLEKIARVIKGVGKKEENGEVSELFKRGAGWYLYLRTESRKRYKGKIRINIYSFAKTVKSRKAFEDKLEEQLSAIVQESGWTPIARRSDKGKPSQVSFETFFEGGNDCSQLTDDEVRRIGARFDSICEKIAIATSRADDSSIESDCHSHIADKEEQPPCSMATTYEAEGKSSEKREIDKSYWENYYKFWDWFVQEWFKERAKNPDSIKYDDKYDYKNLEEAFKRAVDGKKADDCLEVDELPTPYLGDPRDGVDAVIINLNPGLSEIIRFGEFLGENSDKTQYFSNRGKPLGWLIDEFENNAKGEYSKFIGIDSNINWSCLNPALLDTKKYPRWVCGVDWWQGYDKNMIERRLPGGGKFPGRRRPNQRMPWINRIYRRNISLSKVFALELCPYHSKGFGFDNGKIDSATKKVLVELITEHVIQPAATAVVENVKVQFALAVGKAIADVLDEIGAKCINEWSLETQNNKRTYKRYVVRANDGRDASIIVTWMKYNQGIPAPVRDCEGLERQILKECGFTVGGGIR